jgi:hypothetical protein
VDLVDTSVWIEFLRPSGSREIQRRLGPLIRGGQVAITEWIVLELMTGLRSTERPAVVLGRFEPLERLPVTGSGWKAAWTLAGQLRRKGVSTSAADCLIATVAIGGEARLVHCDSDFELIAAHSKLKTLDWSVYR